MCASHDLTVVLLVYPSLLFSEVREDAEGGTVVVGAQTVPVSDAAAVLACLHEGEPAISI
jgi:hypothetical protein